MWNKIVLVLSIITTMFLLSGCSKGYEIPNNDIIGDYSYSECVYLNGVSSATMEGYRGSNNKNLSTFIIKENELTIYNDDNEVVEEYTDIEYIEVDLDLDIDNMFSIWLPDFLDNVEHRYDIYSNGKRIEYIIYMNGEDMYIAESKYLGGTTTASSIWAVYSIK